MRREFFQTHTVRYDECNCDGFLTPAAFLRYMQDIAALDAEDAQLGGDGYWVVRRTVISFARPVSIHTRLHLRTFGLGFTRIAAQRGYQAYLEDSQDESPVINAHTLWVYLDPRGRPARLPERTVAIWLPDGSLPIQPDEPFPAPPETAPETTAAVVRFSHVDPMRHMNNASAVELLDNAGWDACIRAGLTPDNVSLTPLHYDIEYLDSPLFGEQLTLQTWLETPQPGQTFERLQTITREQAVMVRARSRWLWNA